MKRYRSAIVGIFCLLLGACATTDQNHHTTEMVSPPPLSEKAVTNDSVVVSSSATATQVKSGDSSPTPSVDNQKDEIPIIKEEKNFELIVTTISRHNGVRNTSRDWWKECDRKRPNGRPVYNECNWGLGIRYHHKEGWLGGKRFSDVVSLKNSLEGRLNAVGTGVIYDIATVGDFTFTASTSLLAGHYTLRHGHSRNVGAVAFETGVQYKKSFSTNVSCIPRTTFKQFVVCTVNFRFPFTL